MIDLSKCTLAELEAEIERRKAEPDYAAWEPKWQAFQKAFGFGKLPYRRDTIRALIAAHNTPLAGEDEIEKLCDDCSPVGYPTDKTRCDPCPRRAHGPKQTDDWIPWTGGECPVLGDTVVDMKFIGGSIASAERAKNWGWGAEQISQIIAYRVVKEP